MRRSAGVYVFNRYGHRGLEKLGSLASQVEVRADSGGTLSVFGDRYVAIAPLRFQRLDGRSHLVFEADARGRVRHLFTGESIARVYERVPWHETAVTQLAVVGFCAAVFLWALLVWPIAMALRFSRRKPSNSASGRRMGGVPLVLGGLNLLFLVGLGAYLLKSPSELEYAVPPLFIALLTIPLLSTVIAAALLLQCARLWRDPAACPGLRVHYSLVTLAQVGFIAWLAQWNLLGHRF